VRRGLLDGFSSGLGSRRRPTLCAPHCAADRAAGACPTGLAAEVAIECTVPCFASTPISAFSPKWRAGRGSFLSAALSTLRDALASYGSHYPTLSPTTRQGWNNCGLASFILRSHCTVPRFGPDKTLYLCLAPFERAINVLVDRARLLIARSVVVPASLDHRVVSPRQFGKLHLGLTIQLLPAHVLSHPFKKSVLTPAANW
jgi:hypothetical protein